MARVADMTSWKLVLIMDDDLFTEYSATPGDYFQHGLDDDLGGDLFVKRPVWIDPDRLSEFCEMLELWDDSRSSL